MPEPLVPHISARAEMELPPEALDGVLWRRVLAYCVDLIVISLLCIAALMVFVPVTILSFGLLATPLSLAFGLIPITYHTLMIGRYGATLGQRLFDLEVVDLFMGRPSYVQALVQSAIFYLSVAITSFLVLGFVFFNRHRRTLHDWLSGTIVMRRGAYGRPAPAEAFGPR